MDGGRARKPHLGRGEQRRSGRSQLDIHPTFLAYSWPTATTLTLNTETLYDWNAEQWTVPVNILLSQVFRIGNQPVSLQVGYRWYAESAQDAPDWGIRFAVTLMCPR